MGGENIIILDRRKEGVSPAGEGFSILRVEIHSRQHAYARFLSLPLK